MIPWSIPGAEAQPILGEAHLPDHAARGVIVIAHGFKGYKDYGMLPRLAREGAAAGFISHRFNFSHSGMTNAFATFERPDLFERDTWSKQVVDLTAVLAAATQGALPGGKATGPLFALGHSRGGTVAMLTAGRLTEQGVFSDQVPERTKASTVHRTATPIRLAGIVALSAPSSCNPFTPEQEQELLERGWIESPSTRTGQALRVGRAFLQEQRDDSAGHDVLAHVSRIACPVLVVHGERDEAVAVDHAQRIAAAAGTRAMLRIIPGGDHVFNTPNPLPYDQASGPQLREVIREVLAFLEAIAESSRLPRLDVS